LPKHETRVRFPLAAPSPSCLDPCALSACPEFSRSTTLEVIYGWRDSDGRLRCWQSHRRNALQSGPRCLGCRGGSRGIFMRLVRLRAPGGLENLKLVEEDHPKPRPDELLVRIRASSLNSHDDLVVLGKIPCADGR